jgi:hypothetical protein
MMSYDLIKAVLDSLEENEYFPPVNNMVDSFLKNQKSSYNRSIKKGGPKKIGNRTIYPVIIVTSLEIEDKIIYEGITPFALAVIEPDKKYFISLEEENQEIAKLISKESLWDELEIK